MLKRVPAFVVATAAVAVSWLKATPAGPEQVEQRATGAIGVGGIVGQVDGSYIVGAVVGHNRHTQPRNHGNSLRRGPDGNRLTHNSGVPQRFRREIRNYRRERNQRSGVVQRICDDRQIAVCIHRHADRTISDRNRLDDGEIGDVGNSTRQILDLHDIAVGGAQHAGRAPSLTIWRLLTTVTGSRAASRRAILPSRP